MRCRFKKNFPPPFGFTLLEVLIVIGVITVLIAVLIPAAGRTGATANRAKCINNLRQLHFASMRWSQDHQNRLPGWQTWSNDLRSYIVMTRVEQKSGLSTIATCPTMYGKQRSVSPVGHTYAMNHRTGTKNDWDKSWLWFTNPSQVAHFVDGFVTGKSADQLWWIYSSAVYPDTGVGNVKNLEFPHGGEVNIVYMDGHVESFNKGFLPHITDKSDPLYPIFWGTRQ